MKKLFNLLGLLLIFNASHAFDNEISAISARPNSNELYIGGEFSTVFVVDKESGETTRTFSIEEGLTNLEFSPDGSILLAKTSGKVLLLDPNTGKVKGETKVSSAQLFERSPYFVNIDSYKQRVVLFSSTTGAFIGDMSFDFKPDIIDITSDNSKLIIIGKSEEIKGEKKLIQEKVEQTEGYNLYERTYVDQQEDGEGCEFRVIDIKSMKTLLESTLPYSFSKSFGISISSNQGNYFIGGWNSIIRVNNKGEAFPISYEDPSYAYAAGSSATGDDIVIASTKEGYIYNCTNKSFKTFDFSESGSMVYSKDIDIIDNQVYLLNKDYSINVLSIDGANIKTISIDHPSVEFGVFYYNGYRKKEDRDKEAGIINAALENLSQSTIDLESDIGQRNFLIASFSSYKEAKDFADNLKKNRLNYATKVAPVGK